jgi:hypothetical protein
MKDILFLAAICFVVIAFFLCSMCLGYGFPM